MSGTSLCVGNVLSKVFLYRGFVILRFFFTLFTIVALKNNVCKQESSSILIFDEETPMYFQSKTPTERRYMPSDIKTKLNQKRTLLT